MNEHAGCVLSVDAGGTFLKAALVRHDRTLVEGSFLRIPVDSDGGIDSIRASFARLAAAGLAKASEQGLALDAVGVCIPGPFDYANGISLMTHKYLSIRGIPLRPWLREGAGDIPVVFLHDSHAFLLGGLWEDPAYRSERVAGVTIGTGLGFAAWIDGKIYANAQGGPGISIFARPYRDGVSEDYVSRRAVLSRYRALTGTDDPALDAAHIAGLAREGQSEAAEVFAGLGRDLAGILHGVLRDNGFGRLLLGGAISKSADLFLPELKNGLKDLECITCIAAVKDIDMAPVFGAARAVLFPDEAVLP